MQGKTVLVTGANTGIGKETALALARLGADVILTARDDDKGARAAEHINRESGGTPVEYRLLDLASLASVRRFADDFLTAHDRLHVLVNNAGAVIGDRRETADGFEMTFGVNHLGPFLLTKLLLDLLCASAPSRIVNVSSAAHQQARRGLDFDDLQSRRSYSSTLAYGRSKLANVYFTTELARRLAGTGVTANAVHPGVVATEFGAGGDARGIGLLYKLARPFMRTAEQGARTTLFVATAPELEGVTGRYFANSSEATPSAVARDEAAARRLWDESEVLIAPRVAEP